MSPERWQQIQNVFDEARACEPDERAAFLKEACEGDEELRWEIEWMLAHQDEAKRFIDAPALELAAISVAADPGASLAGSSLGSYEDLRLIGRGGMGEVYRARDSKLMRDVAIKVLPKAFVSDSGRLARFQLEAQVLGSLNHPNISTIHDIQEDRGVRFLVLEYVEGETLAARLKRGPLHIDDILSLLKQVAEALEAAHQKGILHRDLKPANIQITPEGRVKVLDFGLAKMIDAERRPDVVHSSGNGIFGTASYMSPEQASGGLVDRRTDIWAFGCVLYEMLTGRRAFGGENPADIIAAIMKSEPDYESLPAITPAAVRTLLRRCLRKQPKHRLHDISDVRIAIEDAQIGLQTASPPESSHAGALEPVRQRRERLAWSLAVLAGLLALLLAVPRIFYVAQKKQDQAVHFLVDPPPMPNPFQVTVSPDGRTLAFVAGTTYTIQPPDQTTSASVLYVRPMNSTNAQPLTGTEAAANPFWSPDSRYIAFGGSGSKLKKIDANGGLVQNLCDLSGFFGGGTWNSEGVILFSDHNVLYRVYASGGVPTQVTDLDQSRQEVFHRFPYFLPDGRHYLYLAWSSQPQNRAIFIGSLDSKEKKLLMRAESIAMYANPGELLFLRGDTAFGGTLLAQPFDASRLEFTGEAVPVAEGVAADGARPLNSGPAAFAVSSGLQTNVLVYRSVARVDTEKARVALVDRSGRVIEKIGMPGGYLLGDLSPDGERLAVHIHQGTGGDVWIMEISSGKMSRLTFDPSQDNGNPIWSPDGQQIVFCSRRNGKWGIYRKPSYGTGSEELLVESDSVQTPWSWSRDGAFILYSNPGGLNQLGTGYDGDVWALPLHGEGKPIPLLHTRFIETHAQISPDGKWFAYQSDETGRFEIYVQSFPPGDGKWQISRNGGVGPRWRPDGKELFFMDTWSFSKVLAAEIRTNGSTLQSSEPRPLFESGFIAGMRGHDAAFTNVFAVSRDGTQFVIPRVEGQTAASVLNPPITAVLNWTAALKK